MFKLQDWADSAAVLLGGVAVAPLFLDIPSSPAISIGQLVCSAASISYTVNRVIGADNESNEDRSVAGYKMKPLEWAKGTFNEIQQSWSATTPFATFSVFRFREGYLSGGPNDGVDWNSPPSALGWDDWRYKFTFVEYFDEGESACETAEEGKRLCEMLWQARLAACLTVDAIAEKVENSHE